VTVMPTPLFVSTQYHLPDRRCLMSRRYNSQSMPLHPQDRQHLSQSMQPPSPPIPIDPALALYPTPYYSYHAQQHPQVSQQLSLVPGLSSPSSQASDAMSTPPTEPMSFSGSNKRPPSSSTLDDHDHSKRRKEDDGSTPSMDGGEPKAKPTRGSRSDNIFFTSLSRFHHEFPPQSVYSLPAPQNEMCRRRAGTSVQALQRWESRMYFRRVQSWQAYIQVRLFFLDDSTI
jgi:hypothetical protein